MDKKGFLWDLIGKTSWDMRYDEEIKRKAVVFMEKREIG